MLSLIKNTILISASLNFWWYSVGAKSQNHTSKWCSFCFNYCLIFTETVTSWGCNWPWIWLQIIFSKYIQLKNIIKPCTKTCACLYTVSLHFIQNKKSTNFINLWFLLSSNWTKIWFSCHVHIRDWLTLQKKYLNLLWHTCWDVSLNIVCIKFHKYFVN